MAKSNFVCLLIAVAVSVVIFAIRTAKEPIRPREPGVTDVGNYDRIQISINAATAKSALAMQVCEREINAILEREFAELERNGNLAAEEIAGYGSCCKIIYLLAKDKIRGTSSAVAYVEETMGERLGGPLRNCSESLKASLGRFDLALKESTVVMATELAQMNPAASGRQLEVTVELWTNEDVENALRNLGFQGVGIGVGAAFDVWAILKVRLVQGLISKATTVAAYVFARPAAAAATEATLVAIDGPLPIGDVIAAVGGIWTAYDIYSSRQEFERELKTGLANSLPDIKRSVGEQLNERIRSILQDYQRTQDDIRIKSLTLFTP